MTIDVSALESLYTNLQTTLINEIAYEAANGAKPSYSVGNRSVDWNGYRASILKQMEDLLLLISKVSSFDLTQQTVIGNKFIGGNFGNNPGGW